MTAPLREFIRTRFLPFPCATVPHRSYIEAIPGNRKHQPNCNGFTAAPSQSCAHPALIPRPSSRDIPVACCRRVLNPIVDFGAARSRFFCVAVDRSWTSTSTRTRLPPTRRRPRRHLGDASPQPAAPDINYDRHIQGARPKALIAPSPALAPPSHRAQNTKTIVAALTLSSHSVLSLPELPLQQHLQLNPDLSAYSTFDTEADSEPLMMAQPVPHPATDRKRVKVYELRNNDWFDRGTGFCTATFITTEEGRKDPRVIVESEEHPERLLLETKIQKEDGFQKQQETLIVWQEPETGMDMALSFQEAEGCALIWRFVSSVQQTLSNNIGGDDGLSDDLAMDISSSINLPAPELGNLPEIESNIRIMGSGANGREALTKFIMADDYIGKLIPLVEMAEDLESLPDLHRLCNIMKSIILLNDTTIIEHAVSDDCLLGVVGALEYDPDFPSHKANHRHWFSNRSRYKEVIPIEDEQTRHKIHQTYRLQYLKDVVLARILDDPTFSVLNSLIFFNQVDIVQHLQSNQSFLSELFGVFNVRCRDDKKKREAVLFIQQCCAVAKGIQTPARQSLYNNMIAHGLLQVVHFGLRHADVGVRVGATDILISMMDHDPQSIRQTVYRQMHDGQLSLVDSLIDLLLIEVDLGVKSQISDALKVLVDQGVPPPGPDFTRVNGEFPAGRVRPQPLADPQQELFLIRLYERSAPKLFKPLFDLEHQTNLDFGVQKASIFTYLVELLSFFIRQHHRFSRYFVMNHNLVERVACLLKSSEKYLQLEKQVLSPVLDVLIKTLPRDNLLSSACLDLFEFVKKENIKDLVKCLVANRRESLTRLSYMTTIHDLILRYDQAQGFTPNMDYSMEGEHDMTRKLLPNARLMENLPEDPTEEEYWNTSDPDDEDDEQQEELSSAEAVSSNGSSTPSKLLVDYPSDEEVEDHASPENVLERAIGTSASEAPVATEATGLPTVAPPLERLSEKRRREEDEEDELGKLLQNKRRNSTSSESNASASPRLSTSKRKSFGGGSGSGKINISLSSAAAVKTGGGSRSEEDS
ncbi:hypothetical protein E4U55_002874 [Claviceps digitariae]|nr:hypothetical protein E4U55_002874 [Claviceps digitariae]